MQLTTRRVTIPIPRSMIRLALKCAVNRDLKAERFGGMTYGNVAASLNAHVVGAIAEAGACILFDAPFDEETLPAGDGGIDLLLPKFGAAQIKATTYTKDPWLRVPVDKMGDCQTFLLFTVDTVTGVVQAIGWAKRRELEAAPRLRLVKGGPENYVLMEQELHGFGVYNATGAWMAKYRQDWCLFHEGLTGETWDRLDAFRSSLGKPDPWPIEPDLQRGTWRCYLPYTSMGGCWLSCDPASFYLHGLDGGREYLAEELAANLMRKR